jgi:hypothetical protein
VPLLAAGDVYAEPEHGAGEDHEDRRNPPGDVRMAMRSAPGNAETFG